MLKEGDKIPEIVVKINLTKVLIYMTLLKLVLFFIQDIHQVLRLVTYDNYSRFQNLMKF